MTRERVALLLLVIVLVAGAIGYQLRVGPSAVTPTAVPATSPALTQPPAPAAHLTAAQDHARLMSLLHLSALRPGATRATANVDETKANPYPVLPDPLKLADGKPVATSDTWWQQRRQEVADAVETNIYGSLQPLVSLAWDAPAATLDKIGAVTVKTFRPAGMIGSSQQANPPIRATAQLTVWLPAGAAKPVPVILLLKGPDGPQDPPSAWRDQVLAKGWGAAVLDVTTVQPDSATGLSTAGAIAIAGAGRPRRPADWGVLRAWAWGASRALDYLETNSDIDAAHLAVAGHGAYGTAALIAIAYDARLSAAYISSPEGGAAPLRRRFGEQIENLAGVGTYHRFAGNLLKYAGKLTPRDLPVDTHDLFALAAPRGVFVSAGADGWRDPNGLYLAEAAATPVYKLLGKAGLVSAAMPPAGTADDTGELAFRQETSGSSMEAGWSSFLKFAERYLRKP